MKHLLSILTLLGVVSLIFVSCSKSPEQYVENCADTRFIDSRESIIANMQVDDDISEGLKNLAKFFSQKHRKDISFVKSKSLKMKLQKKDYYGSTNVYSDYFKECSYQLERDEVYFKAKWK